jgi:hypothetical protein
VPFTPGVGRVDHRARQVMSVDVDVLDRRSPRP